jgi:hypothetical protein
MAYTIPPARDRQRPGVVTVGSAALGFGALAQLISSILGFLVLGDQRTAYNRAYANVENGTQVAGIAIGFTTAALALYTIVSIGLGVLALFDARGRQGARITTWVIGGLFLCCATLSVATTALGSQFTSASGGPKNGPDQAEIARIVKETVPSWYTPTSLTLSVIVLLSVLASVILLALPAANEYFRKPPQEWEPPIPMAGPWGPQGPGHIGA